MRTGLYITTALVFLASSGCAVLKIEESELSSTKWESSTVAPPLQLVWTYNAGAGFGQDPPIMAGDYVLVTTRNGDLHAIGVESGKRLGIKNFGDTIEAAPLLKGTTLYVPVDVGRRALYAYDLTRSAVTGRWKGVPISVGLLPLATGFVSVDTEGTVRRHAGMSVVWARPLDQQRFVFTRPLLVDGHIILADDQGTVRAFNPEDGAIRWTAELRVPVYTALAADARHIYVSTTRGKFFALKTSSGAVAWEYARPDTTVRIATAGVDSNLVVFGATDGAVTALSPVTGQVQWEWQVSDAVVAAPFLNDHAVYLGSMGSIVYALDRHTGEALWQEEVRGRIKSDLIGYDDFLLVLSEPRYVYLLKAHEEAAL